jgi:calmodulin-lysine N-methyltransferase
MLLLWQDALPSHLEHSFDCIIAADCLFFTEFHSDLLHVIHKLLKLQAGTRVILLNPRRGVTFDTFLNLLEARSNEFNLSYTVEQFYDESVTCAHNKLERNPHYDTELHYPVLLTLTRY